MKINTFVIPHLNCPTLKKTLESIHRNTPDNFQIILVDQNKKYQKVDDLVDIHIFAPNKVMGFAKSVNLGIRLADTKYVSVWNDDCECINKKWWDGVMETFDRYSTALGVNPASPRNPRAAGEAPIDEWEYKPDFSDEEYDKLVKEHGKGHIIDGICTFATVFLKDRLEKTAGYVPGCYYDEYFYPAGGEDYDLNRRARLTKNPENEHKGYRMLGTGLSYVWHWWYSSKKQSGETGVKHCGSAYSDKWGIGADIYGKKGKQLVPNNIIKPLEECINEKW